MVLISFGSVEIDATAFLPTMIDWIGHNFRDKLVLHHMYLSVGSLFEVMIRFETRSVFCLAGRPDYFALIRVFGLDSLLWSDVRRIRVGCAF